MSTGADPHRRDRGYALVAAVAAVAVFAFLAFQVLASNQGSIATVAAETRRARLTAAADAGIAIAIHGLTAEDRGQRWSPDGRVHTIRFGDIDLSVTVEDERGKAPLNALTDGQARALFAGAGASGDQLDALVAEFRDWVTDPASGVDTSAAPALRANGQPVRHGPMSTVGELAALPDMTLGLLARIAPAVTVFGEEAGTGFNAEYASPLAKAAVDGDALADPETLDNQTQVAGERPDEAIADATPAGAFTIRVIARDRNGAQTHRMEVIECTGGGPHPYWVRYAE